MTALIELRDVNYAVNGHSIFSGLNMEIASGRITAVMGPSGTGKTTLLKLITGQVRATHGRVLVDGKDMAQLTRHELYQLRLRMGLLFQEGALFTDLTVYENVAFPLREHTNLSEELIRLVVLTKLQAVGLRGAAMLSTAELSGGMARRVALARAVVMDPAMLFYDEPFTGLDPISMGVVIRLLQSLNNILGITSVVVTHDVDEVKRIAHDAYLLADGRVIAHGTPAELSNAEDEMVQQFMNGSPDGPVKFHYPAAHYPEQLLDDDTQV